MSVAPDRPGPEMLETPYGAPAVHSAVLHDRRRPGRREVAPELIPLLRGQGPKLVDAPSSAPETAVPLQDELAAMSGIVRGLGIASLGWAAVGFLVLR